MRDGAGVSGAGMSTSTSGDRPDDVGLDPLVDRATRLFEFLTRVQKLTSQPVRHVDSYRRDEGSLLWFANLPDHGSIQSALVGADPSPDDPLLVLDRVRRYDPPDPPDGLRPWLAGRVTDPDATPELKERAVLPHVGGGDDEDDGSRPPVVLRLDDHPEVADQYDEWFDLWEAWAERERESRPVRDVYNELFRVYIAQRNAPEEWETVVGVCALGWQPEGHEQVLRHCFTHEVTIDFHDETGRLTVHQSPDASLTLELSMLDIARWPDQPRLQETRATTAAYDESVLSRDHVGQVARPLVHNLSADARYEDDAAPPASGPTAAAAFAPALLFRKRSHQGLIDIFQTIKAQLSERGEVPAGIKLLLDPRQAPEVTAVVDHCEGAWIEDDDEVYLPLPVNDRQLEVVRRVDRRAMTLVQGPPGTGKTHTAAALISHLLAQGKRVLVTAQTDRALKELRGHLPSDIRDLSVSIVGTGRDELSELRVAVKTLSEKASEYSDTAAQQQLEAILSAIDKYKQQKSKLSTQILEAREAETRVHEHAGYHGTLAKIAEEHAEQADELGWLSGLVAPPPDSDPPLTNSEATELLTLLRDESVRSDEEEADQDIPDPSQLPEPGAFADLVEAAAAAAQAAESQEALREHDAYEAIAALPVADRQALRGRVDQLAARATELARRNEQWLSAALDDVRSGRLRAWQSRHDQVSDLTSRAEPLLDGLGPLVDVKVATSSLLPLLRHVEALREYLSPGREIKTESSTGMPKQGMFTARVIKDAEPLFANVRVDGLPPTTSERLEIFATWVEVTRCLNGLDQAWPADVNIPAEDTLAERLAWHQAELQVLGSVIALGRELAAEEARLDELEVPRPDWNDLEGVRRFARLVDAVDSAESRDAAERPLQETAAVVAEASRWEDAAPAVHDLNQAVAARDTDAYRAAYRRLLQLLDVRQRSERRDELIWQLEADAATVARQLRETPDDGRWSARCRAFEEAWRWGATATWIRHRSSVDINGLLDTYNQIEDELRGKVAQYAAVRAWSKAVARLDQQARADLTQYAQLVAAFGRTGGRYRERRLRNMRETMQRCRPSVPVWIMPLYRIAQSLQVDADLFDVVIVDEASQAGLEATFLQYLAPKIVVIGDDKQVSPRAVGVDQSQLQGLANQLLYDDRYKASWEDPKRSLFDEARMRFGDLITLVEHRRCVPEIIGFSNRIAYEPDGIRLIPVRQTGSGALEPIEPVFVPDGFIRGERNRINPAEVDAIVDQIEKCLSHERYDGLTFGVVSLTGPHQAKAIEKALMDRLDPREWEARDLRCGTAPDFQGSERDVMFLSMVAVMEEGRRYAPLVADMYVQQFNVAASRAKDQMWVFHSVRPEELPNHDDMRYQLLDYCYGVARRRAIEGSHSTSPVPEDRVVPPFDSMFEQRVHNRIFDRGYTVVPQYEVEPWRIDLVVVGAQRKLAVECDGDEWHGPDRYQADMARQRELQRCGWRFFRVRGSEFNIDAGRALAPLWELLDELDIRPSGWLPDIGNPSVESTEVAAPRVPLASNSENELTAGSQPGESRPSLHSNRPPSRPPSRTGGAPTADDAPAAADGTDTGGQIRPLVPGGVHPGDDPGDGPVAHSVGSDNVAEKPWEVHGDQGDAASDELAAVDGPLEDLAAVYQSPAPYRHWDTSISLPDPIDARPSERSEALRRIVEVEGPILGDRLYHVYVKSCGGSRVGSAIRRALNRTTSQMERDGALVSDDPLREGGQVLKTFHLPHQPPLDVRQRGERTIHEIPPFELAARLRALRRPGDSDEDVFRRVLRDYGLSNLTARTRKRLEACLTLVDGDGS